MKLSDGQTRALWSMLARAWAAHCRATGTRESDSKAKERWRRELLEEVTGLSSLTAMPRGGGHFARFMARLEVIAGDGIRWQMQAHGADERTLLHKILGLIEEHDLDYDYTGGVVKQALQRDDVPSLDNLPVADLLRVLDALNGVCRRLKREVAA